jgi:Na+-transporting NADH:ubiquinone oxidoreductase subunit C
MSANNSFVRTIVVALAICLVCSILVSSTAVVLKERQQTNAKLDKQKNILRAANLYQEGMDVQAAFANIDKRFVDLATGKFITIENPDSFNQRKAAKTPETSIDIENDIAQIGRRSTIAAVYLVRDNQAVETIILPVHAKGLFSTLYGFIAIAADKQTVVGLKFYEHGETAGLGGEIENPKWLAKWPGKTVLNEQMEPVLQLVKGGAAQNNQVDALSGATWTTAGVQNMLNYWLSENGFGPFLSRLDVNKGEA